MEEKPENKRFVIEEEIMTNQRRWSILKSIENRNRNRKIRKMRNRARRRQKYGGNK